MNTELDRLLCGARAPCPTCKRRGLGYANHRHAHGYKDHERASCRFCRKTFKIRERSAPAPRGRAERAMLNRIVEWRMTDLRTLGSPSEQDDVSDIVEDHHKVMVEAIDAWLATFPEDELNATRERFLKPILARGKKR